MVSNHILSLDGVTWAFSNAVRNLGIIFDQDFEATVVWCCISKAELNRGYEFERYTLNFHDRLCASCQV